MDEEKRLLNERKFKNWDELPDGGRRYYYQVTGRVTGFARYIKIVDDKENTTFLGKKFTMPSAT